MLQKLDEFEDRGLIVCLIIAMDLYSQENLAEICGFVREALKSATGEAFNSLLREDGSGAYSYRGRTKIEAKRTTRAISRVVIKGTHYVLFVYSCHLSSSYCYLLPAAAPFRQ